MVVVITPVVGGGRGVHSHTRTGIIHDAQIEGYGERRDGNGPFPVFDIVVIGSTGGRGVRHHSLCLPWWFMLLLVLVLVLLV